MNIQDVLDCTPFRLDSDGSIYREADGSQIFTADQWAALTAVFNRESPVMVALMEEELTDEELTAGFIQLWNTELKRRGEPPLVIAKDH